MKLNKINISYSVSRKEFNNNVIKSLNTKLYYQIIDGIQWTINDYTWVLRVADYLNIL